MTFGSQCNVSTLELVHRDKVHQLAVKNPLDRPRSLPLLPIMVHRRRRTDMGTAEHNDRWANQRTRLLRFRRLPSSRYRRVLDPSLISTETSEVAQRAMRSRYACKDDEQDDTNRLILRYRR